MCAKADHPDVLLAGRVATVPNTVQLVRIVMIDFHVGKSLFFLHQA